MTNYSQKVLSTGQILARPSQRPFQSVKLYFGRFFPVRRRQERPSGTNRQKFSLLFDIGSSLAFSEPQMATSKRQFYEICFMGTPQLRSWGKSILKPFNSNNIEMRISPRPLLRSSQNTHFIGFPASEKSLHLLSVTLSPLAFPVSFLSLSSFLRCQPTRECFHLHILALVI